MSDIAQAFITKARALLVTDYLPKIERCLEELSDEDVWWRANPQSNSIGNLLLHLQGNVRQWITCGLGNAPDNRVREQEFAGHTNQPSGAELREALVAVVREADGVLARLDSSVMLERRLIQGHDVTILEAVFHVVEHFSMHTGQIILLTKICTGGDLAFYDFSTGRPVPRWREAKDVEQ